MAKETLISDNNFTKIDNLFFQNGFRKNDFELAYVDIRKKEGRLFSNEEVMKLPDIPLSHPLHREWMVRKRSAKRLTTYLAKKTSLKILEIGCGNGWLSNQLSQLPKVEVVGLDVNETELKQGSDVFRAAKNLSFILADLFTVQLPLTFDIIIFASSLQYFSNLERVLSTSLNLLASPGEIHIIDSPFYDKEKVNRAKVRSSDYFSSQASQMHNHYFHHTWEGLQNFRPTILYDPTSLLTQFKNKLTNDSPFPWIRIKKADNG